MLRNQGCQTGIQEAAQIDERPWHEKYAIYRRDFFVYFFADFILYKIFKDDRLRFKYIFSRHKRFETLGLIFSVDNSWERKPSEIRHDATSLILQLGWHHILFEANFKKDGHFEIHIHTSTP